MGDSSTHGKGTVQSLVELNRFLKTTNNLGALKLTIRKFYRINGESTQLKGVIPDIVLPSVNNYAEIGESSIPNAMQWDTIPSTKYEPVNQITKPMVDDLKNHSTTRIAVDKDFAYILEEIERFKKAQAEKTISLNEKQRVKEKEDAKKRTEARKEELKKRPLADYLTYEITLKNVDKPGLPSPLSPDKLTDTSKEKPTKLDDPDEEKTDADDAILSKVDPTLDETRRILLDLILFVKNGSLAAKK